MKNLPSRPDFTAIQDEMIAYWEADKTFEKSVAQHTKELVFYDGPPFATGNPHTGTLLVSFIKDMISRYFTMRGYSLPRQWGWDCHGLPIETQVETAMDIKLKTDIERVIGVDKFNEGCRNVIMQNNDTWREYVQQAARWVDYDGAYKTMDTPFMESVIWAFKQAYDKGLIYKDYRVTPYCHRCETSLSISDTREADSTRPKQDTWVMVKFDALHTMQDMPVYYLAWTTTPWTLPSNMALAVNEKADYIYIKSNNEIYVVVESAPQRYGKVLGDDPEIIHRCKGADIVGNSYAPIFDYFAALSEQGAYKIISADYVDAFDGIGIVHTAPAFGEDDYWSCKKSGVPLVNPVNERGEYTEDVTDFAGRNVMEANRDVIRWLKADGSLVAEGSIVHNYPHCWRCGTPLIYKAMDAWYFDIDKIKSRLIELNEEINWVPDMVKHGRFGKWLENARDWNISRNRYWSTPLPVWQCEKCGKYHVLGSIEEIYQRSGVRLTDLHKQYMDKVVFDCECGGTARRVPEVIDGWFESGAVPFARMHYPFENKEWFETNGTSDFVVEYPGQIRCWFYYLLVLSTALFDKIPFKNGIVHGTLLAKDGKKISKSKKNYTDTLVLMRKYGTDALRLYLFRSNAMLLNDMCFDDAGILENLQGMIIPFYNSCSFLMSYAQIDGIQLDESVRPNPTNELDKWMLAKLYDVQKKIITSMDAYKIDEYITPLNDLIDSITNWYIRNSRRRFWAKGTDADKVSAYETLYYTLVNTCKLLAPVAPIIADKIYMSLVEGESVHLQTFTDMDKKYCNDTLLKEISMVQNVLHLSRSLRSKNNIKNRQPLQTLEVALSTAEDVKIVQKYSNIIKDEMNVKNIIIINDVSMIADIIYKPNFNVIKSIDATLLPKVMASIKANQFIIDGENVKYTYNGETLTLPISTLFVEYKPKDGLNLIGESGIVVAMDLTITPELLREGVAREIIRNVQDMRKSIGCNIMDKVHISFEGDMVEEWVEYINDETLSIVSDIDIADASTEINAENINIIVKIKKITL